MERDGMRWCGMKKTRRKSHDICSTGCDFACAGADVVHVREKSYRNRALRQWMLCFVCRNENDIFYISYCIFVKLNVFKQLRYFIFNLNSMEQSMSKFNFVSSSSNVADKGLASSYN